MRNRKANSSFSNKIKVNGGLEEEEDKIHPLTVNAIYKREGLIMKKGPSSIKKTYRSQTTKLFLVLMILIT